MTKLQQSQLTLTGIIACAIGFVFGGIIANAIGIGANWLSIGIVVVLICACAVLLSTAEKHP